MKYKNLYIGTLSGTSADSIDAALIEIKETIKVIDSVSLKLPNKIKKQILNLANEKKNLKKYPSKDLLNLDKEFALLNSRLISRLISKNESLREAIKAIGSHGQTIQHFPFAKDPYTLQIGNPKIISESTKIKTIANFREANIKCGGIGAPLTPAFHKTFFYSKKENRVIINIGGITNITRLIPNLPIIGWDSGPGNCLIDQCVQYFSNSEKQFDKNGELGQRGSNILLEKAISHVLSQKYFRESLPKSQSIINFNFLDLYKKFDPSKNISKEDWISAVTEITARSIVNDLNKFCNLKNLEIYFCGGGSKNNYLIKTIKSQINQNWKVMNTMKLGLNPMLVEACTFAWLGKMRLENKKIDLKNSTGAKPSKLGEIY